MRRKAAIILKRFPAQRYTAAFNPYSGFFARVEDKDAPEPFWAEHGPELLDVAITSWCDRGCPLCYRKANDAGHHMAVEDYREVMRQAHAMHAFQVALGGGNPNQHPQFPEILRLTREEFGIVPNYTTNGRGLTDAVLDATRRYCGAVAVSAYTPYDDLAEAIKRLTAQKICTNVHFILTSKSVETAINWVVNPPGFLSAVNAVVFLNYKPVGRYVDSRLLANRNPRLSEFLQLATTLRPPWRIGFDSCSATGVARTGNIDETCLESCDAGRFSLFVSEDMRVFPCSFMVETGWEGGSLRERSLKEIWQGHPTFVRVRAQYAVGEGRNCGSGTHCLAGCSLFPEIDL